MVHMHASLERQFRNDSRVHVGKAPFGMPGEEVPAEGFSPFAVAARVLIIRTNVLITLSDVHSVRLPERKRIHRSSGPVSTGITMTIPHRDWLTADSELDRSAITRSVIAAPLAHCPSPLCVQTMIGLANANHYEDVDGCITGSPASLSAESGSAGA